MVVVQQHNFQPNAAARSLAAGRTKILGLVIPTGVSALFTDPYFPLLIQGVSAACISPACCGGILANISFQRTRASAGRPCHRALDRDKV